MVEDDHHVFEVEDVGEVEPCAFDGGDAYVGGEFGVGECCDVAGLEPSFVPFEAVVGVVAPPCAGPEADAWCWCVWVVGWVFDPVG